MGKGCTFWFFADNVGNKMFINKFLKWVKGLLLSRSRYILWAL